MPVTLSEIVAISKRDGRVVAFDRSKIVAAIMKAAQAVQGSDYRLAEDLANHVVTAVCSRGLSAEATPSVETIQDTIEKVLIEHGHARTAKAFILYRAQRNRIRDGKSELMETVSNLLKTNESPFPGVMRHQAIGESAAEAYYLGRTLSEAGAQAHSTGDYHITGLSHFGLSPYRAVMRLRDLLATAPFGLFHPIDGRWSSATLANLVVILALGAMAEVHGELVLTDFAQDFADHIPEATSTEELENAMAALVFGLNARPNTRMNQPHVVLHLEPAHRVSTSLMRTVGACQAAGLSTEALQLRPVTDPSEAAPLTAHLSLNLSRVALRVRHEGADFYQLLDEVLGRAIALLDRQTQALGTKRPFGRPVVAINLVGMPEALSALAADASVHAWPEGLTADDLKARIAACCEELGTPLGLGVQIQTAHDEVAASRFIRLDRRAFGIVKGITDGPLYATGDRERGADGSGLSRLFSTSL